MGALDVTALLQLSHRLGGNVPVLDHLEARAPENLGHVGPGLCVLVGELDDLEPVIRHVLGHGAVGVDHSRLEGLTLALDGNVPARVPDPLVEGGGWVRPEPGDEEFRYFIVLNGVSIRRVSDIDICIIRYARCGVILDLRYSADWRICRNAIKKRSRESI